MSGMIENLRAINSLLRTLMAVVVLGGGAAASYYGYYTFHAKEIAAKKQEEELAARKRQLADLSEQLTAAKLDIVNKDRALQAKEAEITKLNASIKKLELAIRYLKIDHRVARFAAVDQTKDSDTGEVSSLIEFVELNDEGHPIDTPRQFRIRGDTVYVDSWVVKFEDKYVEQADLERGTSLLLFKRIFGSGQRPDDGYPLDEVGAAPRAYARGGKMSDFERKIWDDFWIIANDPERAKQLGIRAAHGGAPFMKVEKGKSYRILLRASGDPTIVPEEPTANAIGRR
jgi:multidrug efflux pump subunit AcrA (membrane-fusion protein)